ncbi:hypothetical protein ACIRVF_33795 [Kitasatospora sp. NPDC101157]|uniref:hypothetical protein n=1 Tax=Kitasatospora sp. NPDC101157 TaxID=3364098 RepID=UPI0038152E49
MAERVQVREIEPESGTCITIPQVAGPGTSQPAYDPLNATASTATVFPTENCSGDTRYTLRPLLGRGGTAMKFRAVIFS